VDLAVGVLMMLRLVRRPLARALVAAALGLVGVGVVAGAPRPAAARGGTLGMGLIVGDTTGLSKK
jgi:hypothetical protein